MAEFNEYTKFLVALLAIVNPLGIIPIYISLTGEYSDAERKRIARLVVIAVVSILLCAAFFGQLILDFFGISISSFRVGGGIMLLLMAISMLQTSQTTIRQNRNIAEQAGGESIAMVPLAMPLLAGPGAISTVIIYAYKGTGVEHYGLVAVDIIILGILLAVMFRFLPKISRHLSSVSLNISTRIMGLILAAIAVEFIANGLKGLFPVLA